jgi:hypothetical protein
MITTNIDGENGLVNGAIGFLKYIEEGESNDVHFSTLWFEFEIPGWERKRDSSISHTYYVT